MARLKLSFPSGPSIRPATGRRPALLRRRLLSILVCVVSLVPGPTLSAETAGQISMAVFGDPPAEQWISVPFLLESEYRGEITLCIREEPPEVWVDLRPLLEGIADTACEELLADIKTRAPEGKRITLTDLKKTGLGAEFNREEVDLRVNVPPELRRTAVLSLRSSSSVTGGASRYAGTKVAPARFSGYLNLRGNAEMHTPQTALPYGFNTEGALNLSGWVLEGDLDYSSAANAWDLSYLRVVKDFPRRGYRLELGDLTWPTSGLDGVHSLSGIYFYKNYCSASSLSFHPRGERELFLSEPGEVEIFINGRLARKLTLEPGPYLIQDFPLSSGVNNVVVKIRKADGTEEEIPFLFPYDGNLLAAGELGLGFAAGIPDRQPELPVAAVSERIGLSDTFSLGASQAAALATEQLLFGLDGLWASLIGNFSLELGYGCLLAQRNDLSALLRYQYNDTFNSRRSFGCSSQFRRQNSHPGAEIPIADNFSWNISAFYSQALPAGFSISPSLFYQLSSDEAQTRWTLKTAFRKSVGAGSSFNLYLSLNIPRNEDPEWQAVLSFSSALQAVNQTVFMQQDLASQKLHLNWSRYPGQSVGGLSLFSSLQVPGDPEEETIGAFSADYLGYRFKTSLAHLFSTPVSDLEAAENTTRGSFATALTFAGGRLSLTRPVRDSFVMVAPYANIRDAEIMVNPSGKRPAARSGLLPAVLPDLQAYRLKPLRVETAELPAGYDLEENSFVVTPGYKSGTLIRVGTNAAVYAGGTLFSPRGEPVCLELGELYNLDDPAAAPAEFFTDAEGLFKVYELIPGRYRLVLCNFPDLAAVFEVPQKSAGYLHLGRLTLSAGGV